MAELAGTDRSGRRTHTQSAVFVGHFAPEGFGARVALCAGVMDQTRRSLDFMLDQQAQFTIDLQRLRDTLNRLERVTRAQHGLRMQTTEAMARALVRALGEINQNLIELDRRLRALGARVSAVERRMR